MKKYMSIPPLAIYALCLFVIVSTSQAFSPTIVNSFQGKTYTGWYPPDTMGAVGPNHCVEMINGSFTVYDKTSGAVVQSMSLNSFWSGLYTSYTFDPRIVYDKNAGRWYAISADNPRKANKILFAYTDGSDPTETWHKTSIDADPTDTRWADFPALGFDQNGVYITANMFAISSGSTLVSTWAIPKVGGVPDTSQVNALPSSTSYGFSVQPTCDYDPNDNDRPYYLVSRYNSNTLRLSQITWSGTTATISTAGSIYTTNRGAPPKGHQPSSDDNIDTGDGRLVNAVMQNGKLWTVRGVEISGDAGAAYYKIDISTSGSASLDEEHVLADAGSDLYYASIAVNESDDIGFGFTHSSDSEYASAYISGVYDGTALDMLQYKAGVANYLKKDGSGRNRWGDYSMTMVDPENDNLFWSIQEYVNAQNQWGTYWVSFYVPEPATLMFLIIPAIFLFKRNSRVQL